MESNEASDDPSKETLLSDLRRRVLDEARGAFPLSAAALEVLSPPQPDGSVASRTRSVGPRGAAGSLLSRAAAFGASLGKFGERDRDTAPRIASNARSKASGGPSPLAYRDSVGRAGSDIEATSPRQKRAQHQPAMSQGLLALALASDVALADLLQKEQETGGGLKQEAAQMSSTSAAFRKRRIDDDPRSPSGLVGFGSRESKRERSQHYEEAGSSSEDLDDSPYSTPTASPNPKTERLSSGGGGRGGRSSSAHRISYIDHIRSRLIAESAPPLHAPQLPGAVGSTAAASAAGTSASGVSAAASGATPNYSFGGVPFLGQTIASINAMSSSPSRVSRYDYVFYEWNWSHGIPIPIVDGNLNY